MASRALKRPGQGFDEGIVTIYAVVSQTGATTIALQQWNPTTRTYSANTGGTRGIKSVTRTGTGAWTIVLQDSYQRLLNIDPTSSIAGGSAAAPNVAVNATGTNVNSNTAPTINIQFLSSGSTAADPASGEQIVLEIKLQNSTVL